MTRSFPNLLLCLLILSCNNESRLSESAKKEVIKEVQQTLTGYYHDIGERGFEAEFQYLDSSEDFFWVAPGFSTPLNYDSVQTILKQNAKKFRKVLTEIKSSKIIPLSRELATYTAILYSTLTDTSGTITSVSMRETGVLIKRKNNWKLLNGQTDVLNP